MRLDGKTGPVVAVVEEDTLGAVGSDEDFFRIPLTPGTAQRVADLTGTSLPTPAIVDAIWEAAEVRLGNDSIRS